MFETTVEGTARAHGHPHLCINSTRPNSRVRLDHDLSSKIPYMSKEEEEIQMRVFYNDGVIEKVNERGSIVPWYRVQSSQNIYHRTSWSTSSSGSPIERTV